MPLDTSSLYPNLHAETTRHATTTASTSPRAGRSKPPSRSDSRATTPATATRVRKTYNLSPPKRGANNNHHHHNNHTSTEPRTLRRSVSSSQVGLLKPGSSSGVPPLLRSTRSRPATPEPSAALPAVTHRLSFKASPHLPQEQSLGARAIALRGDLAIDSSNCNSSTTARATTPCPLQDMVMASARPRSRYARREGVATPIEPLHPPPTVGSTARGPLRGSHSTGSLLSSAAPQPASSTNHTARPATVAKPLLSWTEQDASSFFLTELDAKQAADHWQIARGIAHGSHFLYALGQCEKAVACLADALAKAQQETEYGDALASLLHHHMGIAFKEDGHDKWALMMQKKALELAQRSDDLRLQARALKALGVLFLDRQDLDKALDCQEQALQLAKQTSDGELEARVYANLGNLSALQHQWEHAIACHERDLSTSSAPHVDSAVGQARAHRNLALVYAKEQSDDSKRLDHELQAARINAANAFETDMRRHAEDCVGNIYLQLTKPGKRLADMVASSLQDVLAAREDRESTPMDPLRKHVS